MGNGREYNTVRIWVSSEKIGMQKFKVESRGEEDPIFAENVSSREDVDCI
jgi:hypothetical protein